MKLLYNFKILFYRQRIIYVISLFQESSQAEVSSLNTASDTDSFLNHRDLPNNSNLGMIENKKNY